MSDGAAPAEHLFPVTVYYEDTDMGGIVYHANYLKYIERGRSAWVRDLGVDQNALRDAQGLVFAVHAIEAAYRAPARLDDRLTVATRLASVTGARFAMAQKVRKGPTTLFEARVTIVTMSLAGRPTRLPADLRHRLSAEIGVSAPLS